MYNFHKIRENSQESYFHHEHFNANDRDALAEIKRKPEKKKRKAMSLKMNIVKTIPNTKK